jgi:flagellar protein FliT
MRSMPSQIDMYQEMSALSARMVEAARSHDWEQLIALESKVAALRNVLMASDENTGLPAADRSLKAALIQRILDDDAEIRRHTEPWMEHVRQFLGDTRTQRRVEQAYGAGSF